eukprot:TRINITY_DN18113_c0_g1_i1.p2 TRINITY_DN18113_c0_g1~~TRINITY_DN18113_c0_g1_i1.p2  ORF type:complete len:215 (+),score=63.85 TRINITY_DN18113_c0_g1_i1:76-720(+)
MPAHFSNLVPTPLGRKLLDTYAAACSAQQPPVRPNSGLAATISTWEEPVPPNGIVDFSTNLIGARGLSAALSLSSSEFRQVRKLDLSHNFIEADVLVRVLHLIREHDELESLNLSDNPISDEAGQDLLDLVGDMALRECILDNTLLSPGWLDSIAERTRQNLELIRQHEEELSSPVASLRHKLHKQRSPVSASGQRRLGLELLCRSAGGSFSTG